jgi:hypothetical protein
MKVRLKRHFVKNPLKCFKKSVEPPRQQKMTRTLAAGSVVITSAKGTEDPGSNPAKV